MNPLLVSQHFDWHKVMAYVHAIQTLTRPIPPSTFIVSIKAILKHYKTLLATSDDQNVLPDGSPVEVSRNSRTGELAILPLFASKNMSAKTFRARCSVNQASLPGGAFKNR